MPPITLFIHTFVTGRRMVSFLENFGEGAPVFYDQLVMHDPANGKQGDCLRACVATLLQIPPENIPHFGSDPENPNWLYSLNLFLEKRGLWFVEVPNVRMFWHSSASPVFHMLIGKTVRGTRHSVVAKNGEMIHDPHPSRAGLLTDDPQWRSDLSVGLLVNRNLHV
jgi:hypothetical protein